MLLSYHLASTLVELLDRMVKLLDGERHRALSRSQGALVGGHVAASEVFKAMCASGC